MAANAVAERILLLDRSVYVRTAPTYLDPKHGGLVLCGKNADRGVLRLRRDGYDGLLLEDAAAYEKQAATTDQPFALPKGHLFGNDLDSVLQEQRDYGATVALTPTRYIHAGNAEALKGLMRAARAIERDDVVSVPVDLAWLRDESLRQLITVLQRIPPTEGLILGGQYDPPAKFVAAPKNLRHLLGDVADVGLWRTDLAAFDCLAHGGLFAAIGAGGSLRHTPPATSNRSPAGARTHRRCSYRTSCDSAKQTFWQRSTLTTARHGAGVRSAMGSFSTPSTVCAARFERQPSTTQPPGTAGCPICSPHSNLADRQEWWKNRCREAVDAHERENIRIRQPKAFKPPTPLKAWATLPLTHTPNPPPPNADEEHPLI
jgi:hypothetical protein